MNEVTVQEDRETGLCSRCGKEDNLIYQTEGLVCQDCMGDLDLEEAEL